MARIAPSWIRTSKVLPVEFETEEMPDQEQVAGRRHRQELRQAFHEAEKERLEHLRHD